MPPFAFIVFLEENNFTTKGTPPPHSSYTRYHHNSEENAKTPSRVDPKIIKIFLFI
ncbi:MAG: hypothetical protein ACI8PD_002287 [Nitrospinales bacterium]